MEKKKLAIRGVLVLFIVASGVVIVAEAQTESTTSVLRDQSDLPMSDRKQVVAPRDGVTVYTGQATPATTGAITAFTPDGRLLYLNETYDNYFDVDPVPGKDKTIEYIAADILSPASCEARTKCIRNHVVRVNLSTGSQRKLFTRVYPMVTTIDGIRMHKGKIHDFDRVDEDHIVVVDIARHQVFVVNTTSGVRTWTWDAQQSYTLDSGGGYPVEWTHVNDVEVLADGRIMVSLRNFDRVVFLKPDGQVDRDYTLGSEDDYGTLYEQHNPDFVNKSLGGPAVIVADSENNRVVEYQREDGEWGRSWSWADAQVQWPRDADRLPNGNTLVTDTHGGRLLEINESGDIIWSISAGTPYEAERLSTGDESAGGPSARRAGLQSSGDTQPASAQTGGAEISRLRNIVGFILPDFFTFWSVLASLCLVLSFGTLAALELYWRGVRVSLHNPIGISREQ